MSGRFWWIPALVAVLAGAAVAAPAASAAPAAPAAGAVAPIRAEASTAAVHTGTGAPLLVRPHAATGRPPVDRLADGAAVVTRCQLGGEEIAGEVRTTSAWLAVDGGYVSDAYVRWRPHRPTLPWCDQPADPAPADPGAYLTWAARHAQGSRREYRVPVPVTVAQAILESGWGRSALARQGNAAFGIKCFGTPGPIAVGCRPYPASECGEGGCFPTTGTFRVYRSAADSFRDHGRFLHVNPRYRPAFAHTGDPDRFAREIHRAGYATDPAYSDKLIALMREYDLYRFA